MSLSTLIIGGALLLAMISVSLYGAVTLPPGAQLPLHFGPAGYNRWVPKNTGLVLWPAIGAVIYAIIVVTVKDHQTHGGPGPSVGSASHSGSSSSPRSAPSRSRAAATAAADPRRPPACAR